jgi:hypothetical protein
MPKKSVVLAALLGALSGTSSAQLHLTSEVSAPASMRAGVPGRPGAKRPDQPQKIAAEPDRLVGSQPAPRRRCAEAAWWDQRHCAGAGLLPGPALPCVQPSRAGWAGGTHECRAEQYGARRHAPAHRAQLRPKGGRRDGPIVAAPAPCPKVLTCNSVSPAKVYNHAHFTRRRSRRQVRPPSINESPIPCRNYPPTASLTQ